MTVLPMKLAVLITKTRLFLYWSGKVIRNATKVQREGRNSVGNMDIGVDLLSDPAEEVE